MLIDFYLYSNA